MGKVALACVALVAGLASGAAVATFVMQGRLAEAAEAAVDRTKVAQAGLTLMLLSADKTAAAFEFNCTWAQEGSAMVNLREIRAGRSGSELDKAASTTMEVVKRLRATGKCPNHAPNSSSKPTPLRGAA